MNQQEAGVKQYIETTILDSHVGLIENNSMKDQIENTRRQLLFFGLGSSLFRLQIFLEIGNDRMVRRDENVHAACSDNVEDAFSFCTCESNRLRKTER
jgi:hypothetical protein